MLKSKLLPALVLATAGALSVNQAQAFGSDEAAILVGVAVGGLTTYALQNAKSQHHHHHYHQPPRHGHHQSHHRPHHPPKHHSSKHHPPKHHHKPVYNSHKAPHHGHKPMPKARAVHSRDRGYEYVYEYRRSSF